MWVAASGNQRVVGSRVEVEDGDAEVASSVGDREEQRVRSRQELGKQMIDLATGRVGRREGLFLAVAW